MKIGFLHSCKLHLGSIGNAKIYRIMYEDWDDDSYGEWMEAYYGQFTDRREERGLIYNYRPYYKEFSDFDDYDLIALSLNFDTYPDDFHKFVYDVIMDLYRKFPVLYKKKVIVLAGNEVFEKRGSVEKVVQTTWDVAQGIKNSMKKLDICCWNQKIYTAKEKQAFNTLLSNPIIGQICKYVGYQSLGTKACDLATYIRYIKNMGYTPVDVECGHISPLIGPTKELFNVDKDNGVPIIFFIAPFISTNLQEFSRVWGWYAMQVGDEPKDKYKMIKYVQQYKDKPEEVIKEMIDDIIFNRLYKIGSEGIGVVRIQRILNLWLEKEHPDSDSYVYVSGKYDEHTDILVKNFQEYEGLLIDGLAGKQTLTQLVRFLIGGVEYYK